MSHAPTAVRTDGEAANPEPGGRFRQRRRGPRSESSRARRVQRHCTPQIDKESIPAQEFILLHCNIQGWVSNNAHLAARIRLMPKKPSVICLNETLLAEHIEEISLEGYKVVRRLDRREDKGGGGVMVLASTEIALS